MTYKIGLDFGTTNSIISFLNSNGELEIFKYGPPGRQEEYIPSFTAYDDGYPDIGSVARTTAANDPQIESYGNFKMRLPLEDSEFPKYFQGDRTPIDVTRDYLRELLISPGNPHSFSQSKGKIASLVVSVPEIWQRDIYNTGRERLQKLVQELHLPLLQLVSEPVAAGAYYAWETARQSQHNSDRPFVGNLLVCDMGGGTFDVSLCRIFGDKKVEVLYFDGQGAEGLESAGVAFDRHCVQIAYTKKHGHPIDEKDADFVRLLTEFERAKIDLHDKSTKKLTNYLKAPDAYPGQNLYSFGGGYTVTFDEIITAFEPIAQGIQQVMGRVHQWLKANHERFDHLFLVGGFSQFLLVQRAITQALEIDDDDSRLDQTVNVTNRAYAIAYGACLIANGLVDPTEKFIHTLGIVVDTITPYAQRERRHVPIIERGTSLDKLSQPQFAEIEPLVIFRNDQALSVTLWVKPQGEEPLLEHLLPDMVELPNYSSNDQWRVGMQVDRSQVASLVIENVQGQKKVTHKLGDIIAKMFPGFVLRRKDGQEQQIQ